MSSEFFVIWVKTFIKEPRVVKQIVLIMLKKHVPVIPVLIVFFSLGTHSHAVTKAGWKPQSP